MAAKAYKRNVTEKFTIKGTLNEEATCVSYEDKEEGFVTVCLQDYLDKFASQLVSISVQAAYEEDLDVEPDEEVDINDLAP